MSDYKQGDILLVTCPGFEPFRGEYVGSDEKAIHLLLVTDVVDSEGNTLYRSGSSIQWAALKHSTIKQID